jgi:serine/threonine-protein kinase
MPNSGQRVGEYVLDTRIGAGTFGEVWRARHHVWSDQLVAVKIPTDPNYLRQLQREGFAVHGLVHPNIVKAIGFDPYADVPYLAMEYVPGSSLRPLIQQKNLTSSDAVAVVRQVLKALAVAHKSGVVHRDVKPENILIHERSRTDGYDAEGVVKLTDFGFGRKIVSSGQSIQFSVVQGDAGAKELAGTIEYMSPEQRAGGDVGPASDLYAVGVILYELLTGEKPAGTDVPSDLNSSSPRGLDEVFRRSYARLEKRYQSADEILAALDGASRVAPPPLNQTAPPINQQTAQRWPEPVGRVDVCPRCRRHVEKDDQFCIFCGQQLVPVVRRCRRCGAYPDPKDHFCLNCGEALAPSATVV